MRLLRFIFSQIFICLILIAALFAAIIFLCIYIHSLLPAAWAFVIAGTFSLIIALIIMGRPSPSAFKCAWLALVAALPFFGAFVYLIANSEFSFSDKNQSRIFRAKVTSFEYFSDGAEYLKRLTERINCATTYVKLEYYIIARGKIWTEIFSALKQALLRGVKVKIVYDGVGSALRAPERSLKTLKKAGAEIKVFRKPFPLPFYRLNSRDHRKIAVIDGEYAFTGGVNLADEYANLTSPHGHWKDGGAMFTGEIVCKFETLFDESFPPVKEKRRNKKVRRIKKHSKTDACAQSAEHSAIPDAHMSPTEMSDRTLPFALDDGYAAVVADAPHSFGGIYEDIAASLIYSAKNRVYILTPYLCMGDKLTDALKFAAACGVDVRIIIPHIPDKKLTFEITRTYADTLISHGVKISEYTPGFMHTKAMICDDCAAVGSYNFDFRSMRLNYECAAVLNGQFAENAAEDFIKTEAMSTLRLPVKHGAIRRSVRRILALFAPLV